MQTIVMKRPTQKVGNKEDEYQKADGSGEPGVEKIKVMSKRNKDKERRNRIVVLFSTIRFIFRFTLVKQDERM